jgi:hypothetical protein
MKLKWFTLARLKMICAFVGSVLTFTSTLPAFDLPEWVTGLAAVLTFISVWAVPNLVPHPLTGEAVNPLDLVPKLPLEEPPDG